jgi:hypothetical protein
VLIWFSTPWRCMGEWRYSSTILDLYTRWRWLGSFMPLCLHPWYSSYRRLRGPQSPSGHSGVGKNLFPLLRIESRLSSYSLSLYWLNSSKKVQKTSSIQESALLLSNNKQEVLGRTNHLPTFLQDMDHTENDVSNNSSIVLCICCHGNVSTKTLPSKGRGIHRHTDWL